MLKKKNPTGYYDQSFIKYYLNYLCKSDTYMNINKTGKQYTNILIVITLSGDITGNFSFVAVQKPETRDTELIKTQ